MLKGFTVPKSPFGKAALTPPPPLHYSSDVVGVEFWTDPEAAAATLPNGLTPDPKSNGHAVMMFLDWQFTAQNDEFLDPARRRMDPLQQGIEGKCATGGDDDLTIEDELLRLQRADRCNQFRKVSRHHATGL